MTARKLRKSIYKLNKNGVLTGFSLIFIALSLIPVAVKNTAEVMCIGQTSNKIWRIENNHLEANMLAVQRCNGRD
tara:strand:+ start:31 stop:255 length:225 start_codon:yes stop_codon:yes gene_type:complete